MTPIDQSEPVKGVLFLIAGVTVFSLQDVIIKDMSGNLPAIEIMFVRGLVALPLLLLIFRLETGGWRIRTRNAPLLFLRGFLGFLAYTFYYLALAVLPLADTIVLFYSSPLFVTALSVPLLKEVVGLRRWFAVLVGFFGVIIVMRPVSAPLEPAMLLAVAAALSYACMVMLTRRLGRTASSGTMSLYSMIFFVTASGALGLIVGGGQFDSFDHKSTEFLLRAWVVPTGQDLALLIICGFIAAAGFYFLTQAYRVAQASVVAPFEYSSLPWAILWGYVFWQDLPDSYTAVGLVLVIFSGLYIVRRESIHGRRLVSGRPLRPRL